MRQIRFPLKVVVVGLGSIGRRHVASLISLGVECVQACSEWRRLAVYEVGATRIRVHTRFDDALAERPDAVVIANPTSLHARYAATAIDHGCAVYLEKPAGVSAAEVRLLRALADNQRALVAVGYQLRFNDCLERLKRRVSAQWFGRLISIQANQGEHLRAYHPNEDYRGNYAARAALGGGVLLTQIHDINYLRWLFGEPRVVCAVGGKTSTLEIDVEDSVTALMMLRDRTPVTLHQDYLQRPARRSLAIFGEAGAALWDYGLNTLKLTTAEGDTCRDDAGTPLNRNQMFERSMADFLMSVEQAGRPPRSTLDDACADLVVVDAIRAALPGRNLSPVDAN